ncbi:hypothetical protein COO91_00750 [Nostoc flagelliforme CCNUN1]|uniref:Uncharacterized protein n=1 Tax=Nostoc flagelliforme CCNUN1 TaxID=2038116 RepID=A0A2K8SHJ6_9NOSO|nr:hypothetical protein COO91_00750 [Nostoc flagelliforme CCNUN1]
MGSGGQGAGGREQGRRIFPSAPCTPPLCLLYPIPNIDQYVLKSMT